MSRSPNSEQKLAIEHSGGVLLSAGAGSGKTFVLIEHIIYLTQKWIADYHSGNQVEELGEYLKRKYARVVMMTFTKLAAAEMTTRFRKRIEELALEEGQGQLSWQAALKASTNLNITTIHGFCSKLIKQGYFPEVSTSFNIISDFQFQNFLEKCFTEWIESKGEEDVESLNLIINDRGQLLKSLKKIYDEPALRSTWHNYEDHGYSIDDESRDLKDLFETLRVLDLFEGTQIVVDESFKDKKWYTFLEEFREVQEQDITRRDGLVKVCEFFRDRDFKIPVSPRGKTIPLEVIDYYKTIKVLQEFIKKNYEDLSLYVEHFDTAIKDWSNWMRDLILYVEKMYPYKMGLTYSDLEYYTNLNLDNTEVQASIQQHFDYLIVDEFQDTSVIQFEILSKVIGNNYQKLFCVGDVKQAIYGFRGGELGVFKKCAEVIEKNLTLTNNYRSEKNIIDFNNKFFDFIFKRGLAYEDQDNQSVPVVYQTLPEFKQHAGRVNEIFLKLHDLAGVVGENKKLTNTHLDYAEARAICDQIKKIQLDEAEGSVAILYKRLRPSSYLIDLLIAENIGFTAQVKVPFSEDPIMGIFEALLQLRLNKGQKSIDFSRFMLTNHLRLLGGEEKLWRETYLESYYRDVDYYGVYTSFIRFLREIGISCSNHPQNLANIRIICEMANGDLEGIYKELSKQAQTKYSMDFQFGKDAQKIRIMTAHASKGLEFKHVILGGIYTNDSRFNESPLFGQFPMSLQWSLSANDRKRYKTPQYLLENLMSTYKDFSESKRLFYVACTRAETELYFTRLDLSDYKIERMQKNAWVWGIEKYKTFHQNFSEMESIDSILSLDKKEKNDIAKSKLRPPLFHRDTLGCEVASRGEQFAILGELSVTRFSSVALCPRYFYLQNICRMDEEDLEWIYPEISSKRTGSVSISSAERGTKLHFQIANYIQREQEAMFDRKLEQESFAWVRDQIDVLKQHFFLVSEEEIKFELFNMMITGIPDLVCYPNEKSSAIQIWDFKTGSRSIEKEKSYRLQLLCYVLAVSQIKRLDANSKFRIIISYIDLKENIVSEVSFADVVEETYQLMKETQRPWVENRSYCHECIYDKICRHQTELAPDY